MSFRNDRLEAELESRNISNTDLDRRLGVSLGMTSKYVGGRRTPTVEQLYRFLRAIGWTDEQLKQERFIDWYSINGHDAT
jgi:predicted transcriptional regulator